MKKMMTVLMVAVLALSLIGCTKTAVQTDYEFDFSNDVGEAEHGFADYPIGEEGFFELDGGIRDIPGMDRKGYLLTGNNHSDDLFMYIGIPVELEAGTEYAYDMTFNLAVNVPGGMMGIGGSPGSSVYVKGGVAGNAPENIEDSGYWRINIDKGNQASEGLDLHNAGNVEKDDGSEDDSYARKTFTVSGTVMTDSDGRAWIMVGTDSGFEGTTALYLMDLQVQFN